MKSKKRNYTTISIPAPLAEKIKKRMAGTGFNSLSGYVTYVLRQIISSIEQDDRSGGSSKDAFSEKEEKTVKERLRALGYIE
jgi:hypothetical protein